MLRRIKSRSRRGTASGLIALVAALGAVVVLPGSAFGSVTIGSNLVSATPGGGSYGASATYSQRNLAAEHRAPNGLTSPINGVVVRWRIKAGPFSDPILFRVIRPGADANVAAGAGTSALADPLSDTTTSFGQSPGLPIHVEDGIGIDVPGGATQSYYTFHCSGGQMNIWYQPELADGGPPRSPSQVATSSDGCYELQVQAVIEPDKDGDKLGDETQDPDGGNPPSPPPPPASPPCLLNLNVLHTRIGNLCL